MNCISVLNSPVPQLQASKLLRSATLLCAVLQVFLFYLKMQGWRFDKANKTSCMLIWPLHTFQRRFCSSIMMLSWWVLISFFNLFPHSTLQSFVQTLWCRACSTESISDHCPCQHPRDWVGFRSAGRSLTADCGRDQQDAGTSQTTLWFFRYNLTYLEKMPVLQD